jgi:hypothetical protein
MDKFEKFLRSEMSARRLCELAEGEGLGLVPILQRTPRQPTERPFGRQAAAPFRAVSVCVAHGPRRGVCASRSQPARSFPYGLPLPFCLFVLRPVLLRLRFLLCPHRLTFIRGPGAVPSEDHSHWAASFARLAEPVQMRRRQHPR